MPRSAYGLGHAAPCSVALKGFFLEFFRWRSGVTFSSFIWNTRIIISVRVCHVLCFPCRSYCEGPSLNSIAPSAPSAPPPRLCCRFVPEHGTAGQREALRGQTSSGDRRVVEVVMTSPQHMVAHPSFTYMTQRQLSVTERASLLPHSIISSIVK